MARFILRVVIRPFSGSKARTTHNISQAHLQKNLPENKEQEGESKPPFKSYQKGVSQQAAADPDWHLENSRVVGQRVVDSRLLSVLGKPRVKGGKEVTEEEPGETGKEVGRLAG